MSKVSTILERKQKGAFTCPPGITVYEALQKMAEKNIGAIVVADGDKYLGIMTERDYARKVILLKKHSSETMIDEIMSTDLPTVSPNDTIERCMQLMADHNIRYIPVFRGDEFSGVVSVTDVVNETIRQQKETINHLQDYIHGQ